MSLTPLCSEDLELMLTWRNSPAVRKNMYTSHVISLKEHQAWFEKITHRENSRWLMYKESNGKSSGVVYFTDICPISRKAFWGFYTAVDATIGTGPRMEFEALEYAFNEITLHKLNCEILAFNSKVIRLHEKFGFFKEGVFRDFHFDGKNFIDVVRMGILEDEWRRARIEMFNRLFRPS